MTKQDDWYIPERTRALATMYLTRRPDLTVKFERDTGLDILVEIGGRAGVEWRAFGVVLLGSMSKTTISGANKYLNKNAKWLNRGELIHRIPSPTCLFYFTMKDDAGYYTWMAEPIVKDDAAKLKFHTTADCRLLDRAGLDEIVSRVNDWYNALYSPIPA
jgi:hypothetical protein